MRRVTGFLDRRSPRTITFLCLVGVLLIGVLDYATGPEVSLSVFYVLPVGVAAWYGTRAAWAGMAGAAALTWFVAEKIGGASFTHPATLYWNTLVRLSLFLVIVSLVHRQRELLRAQQEAADTDPLTGVSTSRVFYRRAAEEIERFRRYGHAFTLAYLDIDDFKAINDTHGHGAGDELLRAIAATIRAAVRRTDIVARLGGDEFAVLFVETGGKAATELLDKTRAALKAGKPTSPFAVTFSVGMVTYEAAPQDVQEMLKLTDELMYTVKRHGKNGVMHATWRGGAGEDRGRQTV